MFNVFRTLHADIKGMEVKPCNGKKPLTNHPNGRELDCGHGPDRQDCPSGSYCHQTSRFAKCCNKSDRGNSSKLYFKSLSIRHNTNDNNNKNNIIMMMMCYYLNSETTIVSDDCQNTSHGCCPDKKSPAMGPKYLGCPLSCNCNKLGE